LQQERESHWAITITSVVSLIKPFPAFEFLPLGSVCIGKEAVNNNTQEAPCKYDSKVKDMEGSRKVKNQNIV